ncbi:MAG: response regulator [Calditrichaeota bacterium]|nr:response regulator [Calditrichota bacterium]
MKAKILVVEDSPSQRFIIARFLQNHGFPVETAKDGKEALKKMPEFNPRLIISDIMMPEMDGAALCRQIKSDPRWQSVPVVLMTALNEPEEIVKIISAQADYLFLKEFDPVAFVHFIKDVLNNSHREAASDEIQTFKTFYYSREQKIEAHDSRLLTLLLSSYRSALFAYQRYFRLKHEVKKLQDGVAGNLTKIDPKLRYRFTQINQLAEEIRTPLNNLFSIFELLREADQKQEREVYYHLAMMNSEHISAALDGLQNISRYQSESEQIHAQPVEFNLRECIEDTLSPFTVRVARKQIELITRIPPSVPEFVIGEPNYLRRILFILTDNACKYSDQGNVLIETEELERDDKAVKLKFTISDNGGGLSPEKNEEIARLFDGIFEGTISEEMQDSCPGLFIASKLTAALGGKIGFKSDKTGSEFYFILQFNLAEKPSELIKMQSGFDLKGVKIMVYARQWITGVILEELLKSRAAEPKIINDQNEITRLLLQANRSRRPYRLLILDSGANDPSAFDIAQQIKQEDALKNLKIILLTSFGRRGDARRCLETGISAFLLKPVKAGELLQTLETVLQSKAQPQTLITRHTLKEFAQPIKILIAEDNRDNQKLMTSVLKKAGFEVELAGNGKEAVELFKRKSFDLILMDMQMPVMDGYQATREIRSLEESYGTHIPVIALTASGDAREIRGSLNAGVDKVIQKPLKMNKFKGIIKELFGNSKKTTAF